MIGTQTNKGTDLKQVTNFRSKIMTTITYRGVKYDADAYKAKVLAEQASNNRHDLMYRGLKVERKFASQS